MHNENNGLLNHLKSTNILILIQTEKVFNDM